MGISGNNTGWGWEKQMEKLKKQVAEREAKEAEEKAAAAVLKKGGIYVVNYPVHYGAKGVYYETARVPASEYPSFQASHPRCEIAREVIEGK